MNQTTKKWTILLGTMVLAAGLTACGKNTNNNGAASPSASAAVPTAPSSSDVGQTKEGAGEFVGAADPHTVEIKVEGAATAFQVGEGLEDAVAGLQSGDQVTFEYTEKDLDGGNKQLILTKIDKAGPDKASGSGGAGQAAADLPATKELTLTLEGNQEKQTAKLAVGQGFAVYVFDHFSFDPMLSLITMDIDKNYYAHIERLPAGYKLDDIKKTADADLAKVGKVKELSGAEISPTLGGASLMLFAGNDKLTQQVIVKEVDGVGYRIDVNMPQGEPSEGFGPHLYASLSTLTNQDA